MKFSFSLWVNFQIGIEYEREIPFTHCLTELEKKDKNKFDLLKSAQSKELFLNIKPET